MGYRIAPVPSRPEPTIEITVTSSFDETGWEPDSGDSAPSSVHSSGLWSPSLRPFEARALPSAGRHDLFSPTPSRADDGRRQRRVRLLRAPGPARRRRCLLSCDDVIGETS